MRKIFLWVAGSLALWFASLPTVMAGSCDACAADVGVRCGGRCLHCKHAHQAMEGRDPSFNCSCQGSYKFPVPPLSTYFWPGMYSQQLMTDYHSPWRFPPLQPYRDEPAAPPTQTSAPHGSTRLLPTSAASGAAIEPVSSRMDRLFR